jgi:hypothetical protein
VIGLGAAGPSASRERGVYMRWEASKALVGVMMAAGGAGTGLGRRSPKPAIEARCSAWRAETKGADPNRVQFVPKLCKQAPAMDADQAGGAYCARFHNLWGAAAFGGAVVSIREGSKQFEV